MASAPRGFREEDDIMIVEPTAAGRLYFTNSKALIIRVEGFLTGNNAKISVRVFIEAGSSATDLPPNNLDASETHNLTSSGVFSWDFSCVPMPACNPARVTIHAWLYVPNALDPMADPTVLDYSLLDVDTLGVVCCPEVV